LKASFAGPAPVAVVRADGAARRSLVRRYPMLGRAADAVVLVGDFADRSELAAAVEELVAASNTGRRTALEGMIAELMAREQLPRPAAVAAAAARAQARTRLLRDFGGFTSAEVADRAGSVAANRCQLASRWRARRRVFAVSFQGRLLYPGFQFSARGLPRPVVGRVLQSLDGWTGWEIAEWFASSNGFLGHRAPVHLLEDREEEVVEAARFDARKRGGGNERS
jgi:hypothetical protein